MAPKVSVIVPIYNVENYIDVFMRTLLSQTFEDFEALLIDDGSLDDSGKLCDQYAREDSRIRVVHKANGGVGSARNQGLKNARGEYVYFADPDDRLSPKLLERMLACIQQDESDLVVCGYRIDYYKDGAIVGSTIKNQAPLGVFSDFVDELIVLHENTLLFSLWNKLFKRELLMANNLIFSKNKRLEDATFVYQYLSYCNSITFCNDILYFYSIFKNERKTATTKFIENLFVMYRDCYLSGIELCENLKANGKQPIFSVDNLEEHLRYHFMSSVCGDVVVNLSRSQLSFIQRVGYIAGVIEAFSAYSIYVSPRVFSSFSDKMICFLVNKRSSFLLAVLSFGFRN